MAWPNNLQSTNTIPTISSPMSKLFSNLEDTVASLNPITKTQTNASDKNAGYGINIGQATALASGALGMYGSYLEGKYSSKAYKAQAAAYEQQKALNYSAYIQNNQYLAEENLYNVSKLLEEGKDLSAAQMAAIGSSGFDVSAGEQRILSDTEVKTKEAMYLANRSAYLQSFEMWRSNEIENARLTAAAKMARSKAKFAKKMAKFNIISGALNTAAGFLKAGYGSYLKQEGEE